MVTKTDEPKWTREKIVELLTKNDRAVERAILALWRRQTTDEQREQATKHHNEVGFSGAHARVGTYYASWLLSGKRLTGQHLEKARRLTLRYTRQLADEANKKVAEPVCTVMPGKYNTTPPLPHAAELGCITRTQDGSVRSTLRPAHCLASLNYRAIRCMCEFCEPTEKSRPSNELIDVLYKLFGTVVFPTG